MRPLRRAGLALVVVVGACVTDLSVGPRVVASLSITPATPSVVVGDTRQLLAVARDSNGVPFVGLETVWSSSNLAVATVNATGVLEGMAVGSATLTAVAGGVTATTTVTVTPAPLIGLSRATVPMAGTPGAPDPAAETVTVTNAGGGSLDDLQLGAVVYGAGATGWLAAAINQANAPATITLNAATGALTPGTYTATLPVTSATATNSPQNVTITFTVSTGVATVLELNAGDNQSAPSGTAVAISPSVIARDAFNNPVAGVAVTFAVAGGGGNLTGANPATTNAAGIAQITWTLGASLGANSLTATAPGLGGSPVTFNATATAGPAAQIAASAGDAQTTTVNSAVAVPPTVFVTDTLGNPVAGVTVTFAVSSGGGNISGGTQSTDASGLAQVGGWVLGQTAGANTLSATSGTLSGSPVTFTATGTPGAATQIAKCGGDTQTATVGTAVAANPCVAIQDAFANPIPGVAVTFAIAGGGGTLTGGNPANTDPAGQARIGWVLGTVAGANGLTADAAGLATVSFAATGAPDAATEILKTAGDGQTATVNFPVPTPPQVQARDQFGNGVPGVSVTFAVAGGGGGVTGTNPAVTNAAGFAQVGWQLGGSTGANSLTATAAGLSGSPLTFTATGTADVAEVIVADAGDGQTAAVNSAVAVPPRVLVTDALGNPVAGIAVTFAVTSGGGNISGGSQTTNASGLAQVGGWVLGQTAGSNTLTATSGGLTGSPVTFTATGTAGAATQIALSQGDGQSATVNTAVATAPRVVVRDAFNNPVAGVSVTFAVTGGGGSLTGANPATTNASGFAQIGWTLGQIAGANTLTASASLSGSPVTFSATGAPGAATELVKTAGDNQSAPVGGVLPVAPQVQVRDQFGNGVAGVTVTFAVTAGGGSLTGPNPVTTTATGFAQIGWTIGGGGANAMTATSGTLSGSPATFTANGISATPTDIVANAGDGQTATVNSAVTVPPSVLVTDSGGNPVAGVAVTFAIGSGGGNISGGATFTNASGIAQVGGWVLGQAAGSNTLTASSAGLNGTPVTFTATAIAGAAAQIAISAGNGQSATVNTAVAVDPAVVVRDQFSNPVSGVNVTFTVTGGGGSIAPASPATIATNASGVAILTSWTLGQTAGANTLSATSTGLSGSPLTFTATGSAGGATQMALAAGDAQTATVGTAVATDPTVLVRDQFNNPVPGVDVTFTVTAGAGSIVPASPATSATNASGLATLTSWTLGANAGTNTLAAASTGLSGSPLTFTATGTAGTATTITAGAGDGQTATVNTGVATPPAVLVTDAGGNPVAGVAVTFAVTGGGGAVSPVTPVVTNAGGIAQTTSWTLGTTAGASNNTVTATSGTLSGSPVTFTASATAGAATQLTKNQGDGQSATVNTAVATLPRVLVRDQFNNPVANVSVTFAVTGGGGSLTGTNPILTDAAGFASIGWTLGTIAGANTVGADAAGLTGVTFTATGTAGAATLIVRNAGDNQSAQVNTPVPTPPQVKAQDQFGNGVAGVSITFSEADGAAIVPVSPAVIATDIAGLATLTSWTLGPTVATYTVTATAAVPGSPLTFSATSFPAGATTIELSVAPNGQTQTDTVGATLAVPYRVRVTDGVNPVAGVPVSWTVTSGGGSITASDTTDVDGLATAIRTLGTGTGTQTATASVGGLINSPIAFSATATAGAATQMAVNAGNNQSAVVNTLVATPPSVVVRDQFGNARSGVSVTFAVTGGGGSVTGINPATTNASGIAQIGWQLGTTAGTGNHTLTATAAGLSGSPVAFAASATVDAPSAAQSTVAATSPITASGGASQSTITVTVRDQFSNPISGANVTWTASGTGNTLISASGTTNASGVFNLGRLSSTDVGSKTVSATINGTVVITQTATVVVNAAGISAALSTVTALPATITASAGASASTITVTARDEFNNLISGATVVLAATGNGNTVTQPAGTTNGSGVATGSLSSTLAESKTVSATINGVAVTQAAAVTVNAAGAATIAVNGGDGQSAVVNTAVAVPPSVIVRDAFTNVVPGASVTFTISGGGSIVPASPATIVTGAGGTATLTSWTLGTIAGTNNYIVLATTPGVAGNAQFEASGTPSAPSATQSTIAATSPITASSGANQSIITVTVRDQFNNLISGANVTWSATGTGNAPVSTTGTTDGTGVFNLGRLSSTVAQSQTVSATVNGTVAITQAATVVVNPAAASAAQSSVAAATASVTACASGCVLGVSGSAITVTARDAFNNVIPGAAVVLASSGANNAFAPSASGNADGSGVFTAAFRSTTAQAKTISATIDGVAITQTAAVIVTPDAAASIALNAGDGQATVVGTNVATPPSVIVRDQFSNPVPGHPVTFAVTGGGGSVNPVTAIGSDGLGIAQPTSWTLGTVAGTGNNTLTATAAGLTGSPVTFTASATVGAPSASQSSVSSRSSITASTGSSQAGVTVTVRDQFGNPIGGANVTWSASGTGNTLLNSTGTTDGLGEFAAGRLFSIVAESKTISAIVNPGPSQVSIIQTSITVVDPDVFSAAQSLVSASPGSIIASSGGVTSTITVTARDQFGNPLSGMTVALAATGSGNTVTQPVATTNASGVATGSVSSTAAQAKTISATANGTPITQTAAVTVTHAAAFSIALNGGNSQSAVVNTTVAVPPSVIVRDQFSNLVQGTNVTFTVTGGGGTLSPVSGSTIATNSSGLAQVTSWTLGTSAGTNNNTLSAASAGLSGTPVIFTASATVGAPSASQSSVSTTSPIVACQVSCVGASQRSTITVTVRDAFANPIGGATVTLSSNGSNNTIGQPAGTTNSSGQITGTLSSFTAQSKTVTALVNGSVTVTQTGTVVVNPDIVSAATSTVARTTATISACSLSCVAGSTASTITVTARDQFGNTIPTIGVTIASSGSNNTFSPASGTTNASGVFTTNFNSTAAQAKTITATINGVVITQTAAVTVVAAAASSISISAGNSQQARVNTAVATDPSVVVRDAFSNAVSGATVTFSVTAGGGSLTGGSQVTNVSGIATVTSWTLGGTSTEGGTGLMSNTLNAATSGAGSVNFTGSAFYAYQDVSPIVQGALCSGCHGATFTRAGLLANATLGICAGQARVVAGNENSGVFYRKVANAAPCGTVMPPSTSGLSAAQLKIIRAWIRNGALNN